MMPFIETVHFMKFSDEELLLFTPTDIANCVGAKVCEKVDVMEALPT